MRSRFDQRSLLFSSSRKAEALDNKVRMEEKRMSRFRFLALVLVLTLLLFAFIGALVALLSKTGNPSAPETLKPVPQVRQLDRESLRQGSRNNGS